MNGGIAEILIVTIGCFVALLLMAACAFVFFVFADVLVKLFEKFDEWLRGRI